MKALAKTNVVKERPIGKGKAGGAILTYMLHVNLP
jgi:hypothetical protein